MSTINITPFTDVLLVLLIIFMILTSLLKPPPVPEALNRLKVTNSPITVILGHEPGTSIVCTSSHGQPCDTVQVGAETIWTTGDDERKIYDRFQSYHETFNQQTDIIIKAAPTVHYGTVLRVMDAAKSAGFNQFGLANKIKGLPEGATGNQ